jgi:tryptophanyl-tRNA synthetase
MKPPKRILTGDRPTGRLHLGHYAGSLENRVRLQHEYETFLIIADVQALTTHSDHPELLERNVIEVALDYLAVGIDPEAATIFIQSAIPQIAELTVLYSMLIPVNVLRHNPTIKTEARQYGYQDLSYGFLGYPVSQAADITFCRADLVPVGDDQMPVVEVARKIVRRFNSLYRPVLVEPEGLVSHCPRLVGTDGNAKMSKSLNNAIFLADSPDELRVKVKTAVTDPGRVRRTDRGNPEICAVYRYYQAFDAGEAGNTGERCRAGAIGCVACKNELADKLNRLLEPVRAKRDYWEGRIGEVRAILAEGNRRARGVAEGTLLEVKAAMGMGY